MGMNLFDGTVDSDKDDDVSKIEINEEFARRYEHNKKREDLQRFEELKKKGVIEADDSESDESESDDDDDEDLTNSSKGDLKFFDALIKVKKQDPILKNKDTKLFDDESDEPEDETMSEEENVGDIKKVKKGKAMYLKDVVAKQLIEHGPDIEEDKDGFVKKGVKSYDEEQQELRRAFLDAAEDFLDAAGDDEDGEFLKEKTENDTVDDGEDDDDEMIQKVGEYFGNDGELDENQRFLKEFFTNKMWVDKDKGKKVLGEELEGISEDENEILKQEDYEYVFNFRHEEDAGDRVLGHSRFIEGSVRKKTNARKAQRERKDERMEIAELERKEELKHLKNLKKKEYLEKINKVREVAGIDDSAVFMLDEDDLEEEYDPKEHDKKMNKIFNEKYYGEEDVDPEFCSDREEDGSDIEKPDFDKEDELLGLPKGWDEPKSGEGMLPAGQNGMTSEVDAESEHDGEEEIEPEERGEGKRKRKRKPSLLERVALDEDLEEKYKEELENELYKLDYEGTVGNLKTRFRYRKVQPKRFGLTTEEIFTMDDNELNQYVSLKKIAPYREKDWKVPNMKRYELKMRNKPLHQGGKLDGQKVDKKGSNDNGQRSSSVRGTVVEEKEQMDDPNGDMGLSRQRKRRRRQAQLKLSHSRLMAYGKIAPKPKHNTKH